LDYCVFNITFASLFPLLPDLPIRGRVLGQSSSSTSSSGASSAFTASLVALVALVFAARLGGLPALLSAVASAPSSSSNSSSGSSGSPSSSASSSSSSSTSSTSCSSSSCSTSLDLGLDLEGAALVALAVEVEVLDFLAGGGAGDEVRIKEGIEVADVGWTDPRPQLQRLTLPRSLRRRRLLLALLIRDQTLRTCRVVRGQRRSSNKAGAKAGAAIPAPLARCEDTESWTKGPRSNWALSRQTHSSSSSDSSLGRATSSSSCFLLRVDMMYHVTGFKLCEVRRDRRECQLSF